MDSLEEVKKKKEIELITLKKKFDFENDTSKIFLLNIRIILIF